MINVFYRFCRKENAKTRPQYYNKAICLLSLINALKRVKEKKFTLICDGSLPPEILSLVDGFAEIIELPDVGIDLSFLFTLEEIERRNISGLVYIVEDDYLHLPDSIEKLIDCFNENFSDYITLFDDPLRYWLSDDVSPDLPLIKDSIFNSKSHHWRTIESTTFTFAGEGDTIKKDLNRFREHIASHIKNCNYIVDRELWRNLQGLGTYKSISSNRSLISAIPALASHCESSALAPTIDWGKFANDLQLQVNRKRLAINGGIPLKASKILPPTPGILEMDEKEQLAVIEVFKSKQLGRFSASSNDLSHVSLLERQFANQINAKYCLAVSSGTAALHCALVGLGIGPGDEVIVPAYTWMATATVVCNVGAIPIIADIDETLTLDPIEMERNITPFTRAILVVHMRGASAQMDAIEKIARKYNVHIIEDVAQSMGGAFNGMSLGTIGEVGCFSMQSYKILSVGEGGFVTTNNELVYKRISSFHGFPNDGPDMLSMNYKMSEIQGAVGLVQLDRLEGMLNKMRSAKREISFAMKELARNYPITLRKVTDSEGDTSVSYTFFGETPEKSNVISEALSFENVGNFRLYRPGNPDLHLYKYWTAIMNQQPLSKQGGPWRFSSREIKYFSEMCPRAIDLTSRAVDITISPKLSDAEIEETISALKKVIKQLA